MGVIANIKQALSGQFLQAVLKLAGAAALAQAILFGALVVATRLFTPADFGVLAVFNATVTIVGVAACLRFDVAIPLPKERIDAVNLLILSLACAAMTGLLICLLVLVVQKDWALRVFDPAAYKILWMVGPAIFFLGAMSAAQNWQIREKAYGTISRSRILQALVHASIQIGGGYLAGGAMPLVSAQVANYASGVALLLGHAAAKQPTARKNISRAGLLKVAVEYKRFPIFSTWEALFNAAGIFLPVILIGALASSTEVGHLQLGLYAMQAMIGMVGTAISQVYFSRAADEYNAGRLATFTGQVLANLAKVGPGPLLFIGVIGPLLFPLMFGSEWARSGVLVAWMTPWFIMQFLASPISLAFAVTGHQKTALLLQLFGLILRSGAVILAGYSMNSFISEAYAISGFLFYTVYLIYIVKITSLNRTMLLDQISKIVKINLIWLILSVFSYYTILLIT